MNLPELHQLRNDQSTYITFSKALVDFDRAQSIGAPCYFTKMVALNLPAWKNPDFFVDLNDVGIGGANPNLNFPKAIQFYMENILRQNIGVNGIEIDEVTELAFWKLLNMMGMTTEQINASVTFVNEIITSNFVTTENNNGWGELICQIPNKCKNLIKSWKTVNNISGVVQANDMDIAMYDNGLKQFLFPDELQKVLDFDNLQFDETSISQFNFNVLLLFYTDDSGKQKLHGINFIHPFENKVTEWAMTTFTQKTNQVQTVGYQFKFNLKTCNNEASILQVYELQEHGYWNMFGDTLGKLNSFLELKMRESNSTINQ